MRYMDTGPIIAAPTHSINIQETKEIKIFQKIQDFFSILGISKPFKRPA